MKEKEGIAIYHETHRGRILYNPWITRDICKVFPTLKLTADLSHWCVVAERIFDPASGLDDDWQEILDIVSERTHHIHARVGYEEGPQVCISNGPFCFVVSVLNSFSFRSQIQLLLNLKPLSMLMKVGGTPFYVSKQHLERRK